MKSLLFASPICLLLAFSPSKLGNPDPNHRYRIVLEVTMNTANGLISTIDISNYLLGEDRVNLKQQIASQINQQIAEEQKRDSVHSPLQPQQQPNPANKPNTKDKGK
jgi:hypothetical protein